MKDYITSMSLWILIIAVIFLFTMIKKAKNKKDALSGYDKKLIDEAIKKIMQGENQKWVYAHYENQESYGRTVRTTYFRYVVMFYEQTLLAFPIRVDRKTREVQIGKPFVLSNQNLGKITVESKKRNENLKRVNVWLGDKSGHEILQFDVDSENLRKSKWFPVNLFQQNECEEFEAFITSLSRIVAKENPKIDLIIANEASSGLSPLGLGFSIGGVIGGIFMPPFGLMLCILGFAMSLVGKLKGNANKKSFIGCTVCLIWSIFFLIFYYVVMFG